MSGLKNQSPGLLSIDLFLDLDMGLDIPFYFWNNIILKVLACISFSYFIAHSLHLSLVLILLLTRTSIIPLIHCYSSAFLLSLRDFISVIFICLIFREKKITYYIYIIYIWFSPTLFPGDFDWMKVHTIQVEMHREECHLADWSDFQFGSLGRKTINIIDFGGHKLKRKLFWYLSKWQRSL